MGGGGGGQRERENGTAGTHLHHGAAVDEQSGLSETEAETPGTPPFPSVTCTVPLELTKDLIGAP